MIKMNSKWKEVRLDDFVSIKSGLAYKGSKIGKGSSLLLGMGCVSYREKFIYSGARPYDDDLVDEGYYVSPGDIVLATRQQSDNLPILAMPAIIPNDLNSKKIIFGTNLYKVENNSELSNSFLFWLLKHQHYVSYIAGVKSGTAVQMVTKRNVEKYKFLCPSYEEREKISDILWSYENLIENNNRRIKLLEQIAQEVYKEWFIRFRFSGHSNVNFMNGIPNEWFIKKVDEIGTVVSGGTPSTYVDAYWNGDIPWLSPVDLNSYDNIYISRGEKNISAIGLQKSSAKLLPKNTILLSSRAPIGYLAIAENEICTNQGFKSIVCDETKVKFIYLFYYIKNKVTELKSYASGATFPELSASVLKKYKILVPPMKVQEEFHKIVYPLIEQMNQLFKANQNLIKQRDLLLSRLMSGKLEVK